MSKKIKKSLVIAALLILVGCIIFGGVMAMYEWDWGKLDTNKYTTNNYDIKENYKNISITTDTADIVFVPSENSEHSIVCYEYENAKHTVTAENNTLIINMVDSRKWYEYVGFSLNSPKITVSIPRGEYGLLTIKSNTGNIEIPKEYNFKNIDIEGSTGKVAINSTSSESVKVKTSTGNISVENATVGEIDLSVSTGKILVSNLICSGEASINVSTGKTEVKNLKCNILNSDGNTGHISLENVIAKNKLSISRSTGNVNFNQCDADEIFVETDTGDIRGSLLTDKVFVAQTDTGKIEVPKTTHGGKCEISTDTGDIKISVSN